MPTLDPTVVHHPAVVQQFEKRASDAQLRVADKITVQQAKSDHDYRDVNTLLVENTNLTRVINQMTEELHQHLLGGAD